MKKTVPIFYAVDDKYLPYLAVCLTSVKANASRGVDYRIYVLHSGMDEEAQAKLASFNDEDFTVEFVDVSADLKVLADRLHMRDYYTSATYFRIFIAGLFPQYDKALYLDSDVIVRGDICELFDTELGENLVAGVTDGVISEGPVFQVYTHEVLGLPDYHHYFNAGILVMNLRRFREVDFYGKFSDLLGKYAFTVAQDQDYLNVLCKGQVVYLPTEWNAMPTGNHKEKTMPKLIHYNLTAKPWHYDTLYFEEFWKYAKMTEYYEEILAERKGYTQEQMEKDKACEEGLIALAHRENARKDSYYKKYVLGQEA